jgi:hypothetical protein
MSTMIRFRLTLLTAVLAVTLVGINADAGERTKHIRRSTTSAQFGLSHSTLKDYRPQRAPRAYSGSHLKIRTKRPSRQSGFTAHRKGNHSRQYHQPRHVHGVTCYWFNAGYRTQTFQQWVPPRRLEHFVPPVYRDGYEGSRRVRILVSEGYYDYRIVPGYYETRYSRTWFPGYWSCHF